MKAQKTVLCILLGALILNVFTIVTVQVRAIEASNLQSLAETRDGATLKLDVLKNSYMEKGVKKTAEGFKGMAYSDDGPYYGGGNIATNEFLQENLMGMVALLNDFRARGSAESDGWAQRDVWGKIKPLVPTQVKGVSHSTHHKDDLALRKYSIDQFMFLEFVSTGFIQSDNTEMNMLLKRVYNNLNIFEATVNEFNSATHGAYWTCVQEEQYFASLTDSDELFPLNNFYPLTNTSLWAAAGLCNFILSQLGSQDDASFKYSTNGLLKAMEAMSYAESFGWEPSIGLYYETQNDFKSGNGVFYASTQIAGILAYARLYQVTGRQIYLDKANVLINSIINVFGDVGQGGIYTRATYENGKTERAEVKSAFDNALFAYALTQLAIATGSEAVNFKEYILGRPVNQYAELAISIINFMNIYMWKVSPSGSMEGYVELVNFQGDAVETTDFVNSTRFIKSNMLAMYVLSEIVYLSRDWVNWYQTYVIITFSALAVLIFVTVLIKRRGSEGTRLSRLTKGLLADEE
jgi:hypothetical protein